MLAVPGQLPSAAEDPRAGAVDLRDIGGAAEPGGRQDDGELGGVLIAGPDARPTGVRSPQATPQCEGGAVTPDEREAWTALTDVKSYEQASLFDPTKLVREARRQLALTDDNVPAVVVLDPDGDLLRHVRGSRGAQPVAQWACYHSRMWSTTIGGVTVGLVPCVVGGPYAVLVAEQAFVSGCELLINLTSAGRVTSVAEEPPYFVIVERALRDEGTSLHYLPRTAWAQAEDAVLAVCNAVPNLVGGQPVLRGSTWTTDAPYRETPDALAAARRLGILGVEMEAASLYAFATARGRAVLCLAHVTNDVASADTEDFEKGDQGGATAALILLDRIVSAAPVTPPR
jgi:uridine phosphorylase